MTVEFCGLHLSETASGGDARPERLLVREQQDELIREFMFWQDVGARPLPLLLGKKFPGPGWRQASSPQVDIFSELVRNDETHGIGVPLDESDVVIDIEGRARGLLPLVVEAASQSGDLPLLRRVVAGLTEETPTGGLHIHARLGDGPSRKQILARRPGADGPEMLVEALGFGQQVVVAPSGGSTHSTGRSYRRLCGSPSDIVTLSAAEMERILSLFRRLDVQSPATEVTTAAPRKPETVIERDFNRRATWEEILEPRGWRKAGRGRPGRLHQIQNWTRPGKRSGPSATTCGPKLCVFSTATDLPAFEVPADRGGWGENSLTKFEAFTRINHNGDSKAAMQAAKRMGYGEIPSQRPLPPARNYVPFLADCLCSALRSGPMEKQAICGVAAAALPDDALLRIVNRDRRGTGMPPLKTVGAMSRLWACERLSRQAIAVLVHQGKVFFDDRTWVLQPRMESHGV